MRGHIKVIVTGAMTLFSIYDHHMTKHLSVQRCNNGLDNSVISDLGLLAQSLVSLIKKLGKLAVLGVCLHPHILLHPRDLCMVILLASL